MMQYRVERFPDQDLRVKHRAEHFTNQGRLCIPMMRYRVERFPDLDLRVKYRAKHFPKHGRIGTICFPLRIIGIAITMAALSMAFLCHPDPR